MKKKYLILICEVIIFSLLLISHLLFELNDLLFNTSLLFIVGATIFILGFPRKKYRYTKDIFIDIFIIFLVYYILIYLSGLYLGFLINPYSLSIVNIFMNIFFLLISIILKELLRYTFLFGNNKKYITIFTIILFVCIDIFRIDFNVGSKELFELIALYVVPSISKNILLSYLIINSGYVTTIFYLILFYLPGYVVPILPSLGTYLTSIINFCLPLVLLIYLKRKYKKKEIKYKSHKVINCIVIILVGVYVILISTLFPYFLLTIGSNSMKPVFSKGDCVIVHKQSVDDIKKEDILVFRVEDKIVVHRIVELDKLNDEIKIVTKGDNNESNDNFDIKEKDVIGVVDYIIPYIGYPTILLNEYVSR